MYKLLEINLNDKYYLKYNYLFNYSFSKYLLINKILLYNYIWSYKYTKHYSICNYNFDDYNNYILYYNLIFKLNIDSNKINEYYNDYILTNIRTKYKNFLLITNTFSILQGFYISKNHCNCNIIFFYNGDYSPKDINSPKDIKEQKKDISKYYNIINKYYSSVDPIIFKQFLINLKNNNEENNISIPKNKYDFINCNISYLGGLSLSASYKMILQIPHIISTIAMSLKLMEK